MLWWFYEVPILAVVGLFVLLFVGLCWIGIIFISPIIAPWFQGKQQLNEVLGDYLQYFGVIYGLLLGLLAVATYQNHTDVEKAVASEASSLAALYRDISAYPEPDRSELKALIKEYTRSTIEDAWPLQRKGIDPWKVNRAAPLHARLAIVEPQTEGQKGLHNGALRQFNDFFEATSIAPVLRHRRHSAAHVVHGRGRRLDQHGPHLDVRFETEDSPSARRCYLILYRHNDLFDCPAR